MLPEIFMFQHYPSRRARDVSLVAKFNAAVGPFRLFGCHLYRGADGRFSIQVPKPDEGERTIGMRAGPLRDELLAVAVRHFETIERAIAA